MRNFFLALVVVTSLFAFVSCTRSHDVTVFNATEKDILVRIWWIGSGKDYIYKRCEAALKAGQTQKIERAIDYEGGFDRLRKAKSHLFTIEQEGKVRTSLEFSWDFLEKRKWKLTITEELLRQSEEAETKLKGDRH